MTFQVIDSSRDNLLLGTDWCTKTNVKIDFVTRELKLTYNGKKTTVPISIEGVRREVIAQDFNESSDEEIDKMLDEEL